MDFFSKILKHKKSAAFIFLLLIVSGAFLPNIASAIGAGYIGYKLGIGDWSLGGTAEEITSSIIAAIGSALVAITGFLTKLAADIMGEATKESNYYSYTGFDNPVVLFGWVEVKNLANMFIVLGFVIIGIATALRFRDYEAKKLLAPLIIVALLVNFSLVICGTFIDGTNIATNFFLKETSTVKTKMLEKIKTDVDTLKKPDDSGSKPDAVTVLGRVAGIVFYNIMAFIIFILYAFLFMFRHIALWILVILSPLAFVCYVFPFTKKFFSMWWSNFFQWCIIGIPGAFFLYLGARISDKMAASGTTGFFVFFIPGLFLVAGFLFSLQMAPMGAGAATSAFKKTLKGGKALGGAALELSGRTERGQRTKEWLANTKARVAETTGFASSGHTAQKQAERNKKAEDQVQALANSSNVNDRQRYERLVQTGRGAMGAAAINVANKNGDLERIMGSRADVDRRVAYSTQFGYDAGDFAKSNPESAARDRRRVDQIVSERPGISRPDAQRAAVKEAYAKYRPEGLKEMNNDELAAMVRTGGSKGSKALEQLAENGGLSKLGNAATIATHIDTAENDYGSKVRLTARKKSPAIEAYNTPVWQRIQTENPGWSDAQAKHEAVVRAAKKMAPEDMDMDFVNSVDHTVTEDLRGRLTNKQKESFRASTENPLKQQIASLPPGDPNRLVLMQKLAAMRRATS